MSTEEPSGGGPHRTLVRLSKEAKEAALAEAKAALMEFAEELRRRRAAGEEIADIKREAELFLERRTKARLGG
jgi:hypothetical protein